MTIEETFLFTEPASRVSLAKGVAEHAKELSHGQGEYNETIIRRHCRVRPPGIYPIPDEVGEGLDSSYAFHPVDGNFPKHLLRVSKSSMNTFQFCEQQYFIKYILGVKEVENDNMRRGTNVHDAMEDFYNAVD